MTKKRTYVHIASIYDLLDFPFEFGRYRPLRRLLFDGVHGKILDAGVGTGRNMAFYPPNVEVVGIDLSSRILAQARKRKASLGITTELRQMDVIACVMPGANRKPRRADYASQIGHLPKRRRTTALARSKLDAGRTSSKEPAHL